MVDRSSCSSVGSQFHARGAATEKSHGHLQVCTSLQTGNHANTPPVFYRPVTLPAAQPTASKQWRHWLLLLWMRVLCVQCHRPSCLWKNSNCFSHWINSTTDLKVQRHCCCIVANTVGNLAYLTVCCAGDSRSFARSHTVAHSWWRPSPCSCCCDSQDWKRPSGRSNHTWLRAIE